MAKASNRDLVSEVKAAIDIVEVVSGYLDLKPAGSGRFKALCPFHNEKTPSFHVNRDRQTFHCFGCDKGGDVFTFLEDIEGIDFREVLQNLAERAGIRLDAYAGPNKEAARERTELLKLQSFAARLYRATLVDEVAGRAGREYVRARGLSDETAERFGLGYVAEGWQRLTDAARTEGYRDVALEGSGLAKRGQRGLYDHFRNRLMFPIRDVSSKVVAFGGRALGDDKAKYINSPESPVYRKSRVLYGLYEAREALRREKEAIVVEGYFDLLRCVDSGIENVVATCGTALTAEQAGLLKRYVSSVLVVFDGDEAGKRAALRSVGILVAAGLSVRALAPPEGLDPDDYLGKYGTEAFRQLAD
ncbi:MAG: DNA primase, partial [Candidatus Hydrogenedentes bacterium]|nr:DNA primase [Candidatus Hydrogenedentota bacterium]